MRKLGVVRLILAVWFVISLGISTLVFSEKSPWLIDWEADGAGATVYMLNSSYDEVWEAVLDVLLFEEFRIKASLTPSVHSALTLEKDTGLIVIKGYTSAIKYTIKCTVRKKNCNVLIHCQSDGVYKRRVVEKAFQLLKKKLYFPIYRIGVP